MTEVESGADDRTRSTMGIVVSRADSASRHIGEQLRAIVDWTVDRDERRPDESGSRVGYRTENVELQVFDTLHLDIQHAAAAFDDPDLIVFASRHSGETGPLLSAHFTGNVGAAEFGGEADALSRAAPNALRCVLRALDRHAPEDYAVSMECTHHGPTDLDVPALFVELGSDERQWADPAGARAVARSILDLRGVSPECDRQIVGFGGGHYAPRYGRVMRETDWAVGHVVADWSLEATSALDAALLRRVFERSGADRALIDGEYPDLRRQIGDLGFECVSETWLRETTAVPLGLVDRIETVLGSVASGVRFGAVARDWTDDGTGVTVDLHPDLLGAVNGIDAKATLEAVTRETIAFQTTDGGSRVSGRLVVPGDAAVDRLVTTFVSLLRDRYETVDHRDDTLVVEERKFDPQTARELGVPEGPAFGRLARGEPVEGDGQRVDPDDVHVRRTIHLPIRNPTGSLEDDHPQP